MELNKTFNTNEIKALSDLDIEKFVNFNPQENIAFCFNLERAFETAIFGEIIY